MRFKALTLRIIFCIYVSFSEQDPLDCTSGEPLNVTE